MFTPQDRPRLEVSLDGAFAAVQALSKVTVVDLRTLDAIAVIDCDPAARLIDVGWIGQLGEPPRLLVLTLYRTRSLAQIFDPLTKRPVAEAGFPTRMRLRGPCGALAVAITDQGTALLDAHGDKIEMHHLPASTVASAACAVRDELVLAVDGFIEGWNVPTRARTRTSPIGAQVAHIGATDRCAWLTTPLAPSMIEIVPLGGEARREVTLPEPIRTISGHPRANLVACLGGDTRRPYVVHLDDGRIERLPSDPIEDVALVVGDAVGVLLGRGQLPLAVVGVAGEPVPSVIAPRHDLFAAWRPAA